MELTSKQRAYLGGCASTLDPIFQIGKASLTPEIIQALDEALEKRELIKISVLKDRKSTRLNSSHKHRSRMPSSA